MNHHPIVLLRHVAVLLAVLTLGAPRAAAAVIPAAQDTTRTPPRPDSARADSARALAPPDTVRAQIPTVRLPPPLPPPWRFGVEVGFTDVTGNSDLQVFNGVFTSEHRQTTAYIFNTKIEARYGRSNGKVSVANGAYRLRFDWRPRSAVSPFLGLDFESDRIRKIDLRIAGGAGANFNFSPREDRHTTLAVGFIAEIERRFAYVTPSRVSDTRFHFRFATLRPITNVVTFETNSKLQPATDDLQDYYFSADASLRVTITRTIAFRTRYELKRDSRPAPNVKTDDRSFTMSLLWTW